MAFIRKRGDRWQVRWRDPDGAQRNRTIRTRVEAQALKREVEDAVGRGERWQPRAVREEPDLHALTRAYLTGIEAAGKAPATILRYAHTLDMFLRWLEARHGTPKPLRGSLLSEALLTQWYVDLKQDGRHGRPRAEATRRKAVEVVMGCWRWLRKKRDWRAFVPELEEIDLAPVPRVRTLAPTWEECDRMIAAAAGWQRDLYVLLRLTGLRVQQAMELKWEDLDLDHRLLHVRPELGKTAAEQRGRFIPMSEHLALWLAGRGRREGYVIATGRKPGVREREARSRDAARAWKRAGVRSEVWGKRPHHAFRKAFVTGLRRAGADSDAIEAYIGHDLGLREIYTDPEAQPMKELVGLIQGISAAGAVVEMDGRRATRSRVP